MHPSSRMFLAGLCLAILAGCGTTKPSRFYILTPLEGAGAVVHATRGPAVGIGPVTFPDYLDRPEIAHRSGDNQLHYAASDRWAESLKSTFSRTLAENLSILLPSNRISMHPWSRDTVPDYRLILDITRFDADAGGTVVLATHWELVRTQDRYVIKRQKAVYTEAAATMAYPAIVAAQSHAVAALSRDIVAAITGSRAPAGQ